ncbi:helix-turn-helix domain-containing protein [Chitinophaga rupis]|nr:helix-turn-helix domain-containing protein [Chitinophaga rupis]
MWKASTINEVMYDIGYNDTRSFRDIFKRITGMPPVDYRSRFNREVMA